MKGRAQIASGIQTRSIWLNVLITSVLALGVCVWAQSGAEESTGRGVEIVPILDAEGKQVGMYEGSFALVLGASDYTDNQAWGDLPSVINETDQIREALIEQGFSVRRVLNPDEDTLKDEVENFIDDHGFNKNNRLLIFFSGHGYSRTVRSGQQGYLVPVDAPDPRRNERGFLRKALPMTRVISWCKEIEAKHVLFLFDSCFSGSVFEARSTFPEVPPQINDYTSRPVRQFISAGKSNELVPAQSAFVKVFLRGLNGEADLTKDGYITGTELGMYLNEKVLYYKTGQTPQFGKIRDPSLDEGDFVFRLTKLNKAPLKERFPKIFPIIGNSQLIAPTIATEIIGIYQAVLISQDWESVEDLIEALESVTPGDLKTGQEFATFWANNKSRWIAPPPVVTPKP